MVGAWKQYQSRFWELTAAILIPTVLMALIGTPQASVQSFVVDLLIMFFSIVVSLAVLYAVVERKPVLEVAKKAWKNVWSYWWVAILTGLVVLGGAVFFIIPGLILAVWLVMARYVFVLENKRGFDALLRSKEYVEGHGWEVVGKSLYLLLIGLAVMVITMIAGLVLSLFLGAQFVGILASLIYGPLSVLTLYYYLGLFEELRKEKPELAGQPVKGKKGWWIAVAIWGLVGVPLVVALIVTASAPR
jgi:hypothetical protein